MSLCVRLLRDDWDAFAARFPGVSADELADQMIVRGQEVLAAAHDEAPTEGHADATARLRNMLARKAGSVALVRFELVTQRERFTRAERLEQATYERHLELDREIVPPLKLEAKRLRAEIRALEARARELDVDVDELRPQVDWANTIAVDAYRPPRYESNEERRRTAVEFFRRVGGT